MNRNFVRGLLLKVTAASLAGLSVAISTWMAGMPLASAQEAVNENLVPDDPTVATINKEFVSAREYKLVMERKVALVYDYFKRHQDLDDHLGYWSENSGPTGPLAKLREMVREELVKIKVYQGLAKEKGLIKETSYGDFYKAFLKENTRRSAAKKAGEVIYGPQQYREQAYYYVLFGDLSYKLKQAMAKELEPKIKEAEIQKCYEETKDPSGDKSLINLRPQILTYLSTKEASRDLDALCSSAKVEFDQKNLRDLVPRRDVEPNK